MEILAPELNLARVIPSLGILRLRQCFGFGFGFGFGCGWGWGWGWAKKRVSGSY
jgi:hypothetical protein